MPGRRIRRDQPRQLVSEPADDRSRPRDVQPSQQPVGEQARQDVVDHEAEIYDRRDRQDEAQERSRVEDVAMAGGDEGQPAEQLRIPQRHVAEAVPPLGAPEAERVARRVLVAPWRGEPLALEHRQREQRHPEREPTAGRERGALRFVHPRPPWSVP